MAKKKTSALVRLQARVKNAKVKEQQTVLAAIGKGTAIITAAGTGAFEDKVPTTLAKIPTKLIGAGVAYIIAAMTKGGVSSAANSCGDALAGIYAYKVAMQARVGQKSPWVAGDWDDDQTGYVVES